ncbi:hypothetical protein CR513_14111, partial [Mucuna pruriens]
MLFSHIEDYVDLAAIDAFLAKRDRGENPIIAAILANTYYSLNYYYERNGKRLSYKAWLKSRLEQVSLTFGDPQLGADREPDPSHVKPYGYFKWKPESSPEHPRREDANKRA